MGLPLRLALLLLRLREEDIIDCYVDFRNSQSHQVLDPPYNVAAHRFGDLRYGPAILYGQREVDGGLFLADLRRDAAGGARASCHAVENPTDGAGGATTHLYSFDLLRCGASDLGDDGVAYGGVAALGLKRCAFLLLPRASAKGYVRISDDEVSYEPVLDVTRLALAGIAFAAWSVFWIGRTIRAVGRRR
jgi:hypothetical protein